MQAFAPTTQVPRQQGACHPARASAQPSPRSCSRTQQRLLSPLPAASLTATSVASSEGALAIYSWPAKPARQQPYTRSPTKLWSTQMWFEAMVQTVVKQLDGGALLMRVSLQPALSLQLIRLTAGDLSAGWSHIQRQHLATGLQDDAVILVHPVPSAEQPCFVRQAGGESSCPGCPLGGAAAAAAASSSAAATAYSSGVMEAFSVPASTELLHGKFGDCCSDGRHGHEQHSHEHDSSSSHSTSPAQQQDSGPPDSLTAFYGLVVQTRDVIDSMQGCYLLKTVRQAGSSSSCHCTHYSLNKVCRGPSLQQQYQDSWLV